MNSPSATVRLTSFVAMTLPKVLVTRSKRTPAIYLVTLPHMLKRYLRMKKMTISDGASRKNPPATR